MLSQNNIYRFCPCAKKLRTELLDSSVLTMLINVLSIHLQVSKFSVLQRHLAYLLPIISHFALFW